VIYLAVVALGLMQQPAGFTTAGSDAQASWSFASQVREDPTTGDLLTRIAATYLSPTSRAGGTSVSYSIWSVDIDCGGQISWGPGTDYATDGSPVGRAPDRPSVLRRDASPGVQSVVNIICRNGANAE
jgi:hypothetical protein